MDPITIGLTLAAKYAPDIIGYFKGEKAADVAGKVIDIAQIATGTKNPQEAMRVLELEPEKVMEFQKAVMANQTELERMYLADVQSARERDIKLAEAGQKNHRANALAAMAVMLVIICLVIVVWNSDMDDYAKGMITLICGRALGWVEQIFSFEFGTTRTNKAKDETIKQLSGK
jgi:hypothetical protein